MTAYSPILNLPQVAANQNQKETTINTALAILEAASNDSLAVSASGGNVTLTEDQWTKYFMFKVQGHAVPRILGVKDRPRFFIVANEGSGAVTVTPGGSIGAAAEVAPGKIVLLATDGDGNIRAVSSGVGTLNDLGDVITTGAVDGMVLGYIGSEDKWQPITIEDLFDIPDTFLELTDTPASYSGQGGKITRVNAGGTALEFWTMPMIPYLLGQLADVEAGTGVSDGDILRYRDGIWQPEPITSLGATAFLTLTDTPASYAGAGGQLVRVNAGATGLEYWALPMIPTQLGQLSDVEMATGVTDGDVLRYRDGIWQPEPLTNGGGGAESFLQLDDTPSDYAGHALALLRVNAGASGVEFFTAQIPYLLGQLADVEASTGLTDGYILRYRDSIWQGEPFQMSFKDLTDTPDYTSLGGRFVRVNAGATGLEYYTMPMIPTQLGQLVDVEFGTGISDGNILRYRDGIWQAEPLSHITKTTVTNSYVNDLTLAADHAGAMVQMNKATAINVTVPSNASIPYDIGTEISICQRGAGQVTVVAAGGVTINYPADMTLISRGQWSVLGLLKTGTDEWLLFGDLEAL